ncbi:MAG: DUF4442 domain-containing protein [Bacteroidota bacterium]
MSTYKYLFEKGEKIFGKERLFKTGFNISPMYRRSTARVKSVSKGLFHVEVRLKIGWKNRNYMNTIFGGSMFSAVDPIPMIQLTSILGGDYVVWDKSAEIVFKRPAREHLFADFDFSQEEIDEIKNRVESENEIVIIKTTNLMDKKREIVFCEVKKSIYIANKQFYKNKLALKKIHAKV